MASHAGTYRALADALGVSISAAYEMTRRADWPFGNRRPFDVPAVRTWRARLLEGGRMRLPKSDSILVTKQHGPGHRTTELVKLDSLITFEGASKLTGLTDHQLSRRLEVVCAGGSLYLRKAEVYQLTNERGRNANHRR